MGVKRYIRFCCLFLTVLIFAFSFAFSVGAASTPNFVSIDDSDVMDDLNRIGINITDYQKDEDASHIRLLYFMEYGYDYYGNTTDYGLYVYLWNPTGKEIDMSSGKNMMELYVSSNNEKLSPTKKYQLELLDCSDTQGYENVFYKFKLKGVKDLSQVVSRGKRTYDIVGIEIAHVDDRNATDYKIAGKYSFTGFIPYHGPDRSAANTLHQYVTEFLTVDLELHPFSWKTKSSDKGAGYQYEISSVYFSVPEDVIRDYGNYNHVTRGLVQVRGTYNEQGLNGLVTDNQAVYDVAYEAIGKDPRKDDLSLSFAGGYTTVPGHDFIPTSYAGGFNFNDHKTVCVHSDYKNICAFCSVLKYSSAYFNGITQSEFLSQLSSLWDKTGPCYGPVDAGRKQGFQEYLISSDDGDLAKNIQTYASNHNPIISWLSGEGDCYFGDEYYEGIEPIEHMTSDKLSILLNDEYLSSQYFVSESEISSLRDLVSEAEKKDRVPYLLRFAITDYYFEECNVASDGSVLSGDHYYFEKTIFKDFDILELTYQDQYSRKTVIPVVCSPIDVVGSITTTRPGQAGYILDKISDLTSDLSKYNWWIIILGSVILIAVLFLCLPFLRPFLRWVLRLPGRFIRWIRKMIAEMRKKKKEKKSNSKKKKEKKCNSKKTKGA